MVVLVNRRCEREKGGRQRLIVIVIPFTIAPAVIPAAPIRRLVVDLFPRALTDVGDDERAGPAARRIVEAVAPGVPQAEAPDLGVRHNRHAVEERVVGRHAIAGQIGIRHADVDAQHLAQELRRILRAIFGVAARSAVAESDVQKTVGTEREVATIVIGVGLRDERGTGGSAPPEVEPRRRIGDERIAGSPKARDHRIAVGVREVHKKAAARSGVRREGEAQQPPLAAGRDDRGEIEKICRLHRAIAKGANAPALLDDELDGRVGGILNEAKRVDESRRVDARAELRARLDRHPAHKNR